MASLGHELLIYAALGAAAAAAVSAMTYQSYFEMVSDEIWPWIFKVKVKVAIITMTFGWPCWIGWVF